MKQKITQKLINDIKPSEKRQMIRDSLVEGLLLRVEPSGAKTWYLDYRIKMAVGKTERRWHRIGKLEYFTLDKARREAQAFLGLIAYGEDPTKEDPDEDISLKTLLENYYAPWVKTHRKSGDQTVRIIAASFKTLLQIPSQTITIEIAEAWRQQQKENKLKNSSINRNMGALISMINWGVRRKHIVANPIKELERLKETDSKQKLRFLTKDEIHRLMDALDERDKEIRSGAKGYFRAPLAGFYPDHVHPMIIVALNTGIRWGSLVRLRWSDIDFGERFMIVRASQIKSEKRLILPLNTKALDALANWKNEHPNAHDEDLIFPSPRGNEVLDNIDKAFENVLKKASIEDFTWHDFRHTFASHLIMSGVDLNTVRELLGHAKIDMTLRYAHLAPNIKKSAVSLLEDIALSK